MRECINIMCACVCSSLCSSFQQLPAVVVKPTVDQLNVISPTQRNKEDVHAYKPTISLYRIIKQSVIFITPLR